MVFIIKNIWKVWNIKKENDEDGKSHRAEQRTIKIMILF